MAFAVLPGCGDSEPDAVPAPGPSPPPVADFGAEADRLCASAQAEQERIRGAVGGDQITLDDRARLLVDLAPVRQRLADDLGALEPASGSAAQAGRLVQAARRRAAASAAAGARREQGEARGRIAAAAAREHDQRVRFVAIATRLGLVECAEVLSERAIGRIGDAIGAALTSSDPARRCAALSRRYLREQHDDQRDCRAAEPPLGAGAEITLTEAVGMDEVFAVARITSTDGAAPGSYRVRITYEDGAYGIDKLQ